MAQGWFPPLRAVSLAIAIAIAIAGAGTAHATQPKWSSKTFVYRAENKRLPDVIQDFASSQGVAVIVDMALEGTVNVSFNRSPSEFMSTLSKSYGVIWYFDGVTLFAYPARAMQSKVFRLRGFKREQVKQMLESLGLGDSNYPLRYNDAEQTLVAYGPPRHIELVSSVVSTLEQRYSGGSGSDVVVVPLNFAHAADRVAGASKVRGMASTLNAIFGGGGGSGQDSVVAQARQSAEATLGVPLSPQRRALESQGMKGGTGYGSAGATTGGVPNKDRQGIDVSERSVASPESAPPLFQADEATNSVLVRAPAEQMAKYVALIRKLDVAQDLVEIEVTILDVSSDDFDSLGIDWNFNNANGTVTVGVASTATINASTSSGLSTVGANITTLVADAGRVLMARVRALESKGKARVLSRGRVLGAANHVASMTDKRSISVRVAGNLEANLYTVEAGTSLQVLPQIIAYGGMRNVRLSLSIRDGSFEGSVVDNVPTVKSTEIQTDATVPEGESLLIGGITSEIDSTGFSGVKGLSRVPILGALFRREEVSRFRSERMFLLTPKLIRVAGSGTGIGTGSVSDGAAVQLGSTSAPSTNARRTQVN
jgi:type III secretion protein C